ncbi:transcription antitermination NusB family protein [Kribbella swartbergensis]
MNVSDRDLTEDELIALDRAMKIVDRMPREAVDRVVRHLLRVGIYFRRTKNVDALHAAVDSLFYMVRANRDEHYGKRVSEARHHTRGSVSAQEALAALRK